MRRPSNLLADRNILQTLTRRSVTSSTILCGLSEAKADLPNLNPELAIRLLRDEHIIKIILRRIILSRIIFDSVRLRFARSEQQRAATPRHPRGMKRTRPQQTRPQATRLLYLL